MSIFAGPEQLTNEERIARVEALLSAQSMKLEGMSWNGDRTTVGRKGAHLTEGDLSGWELTEAYFESPAEEIRLDSANNAITIRDRTFGNQGIQLDYNSGQPRLYVGDGADEFLKFDGSILTWKAANTELDASGNLTATSATLSGTITAGAGNIGGWLITATTIEEDDVTPEVVLDHANAQILVDYIGGGGGVGGTDYYVRLGADGVEAVRGEIAGWTIDGQNLTGLDVITPRIWLNSGSQYVAVHDNTYGNQGIQLQYNGGTPRAYIGDGANEYFQYDGTNISWQATNTTLSTAGVLTLGSSPTISLDPSTPEIESSGYVSGQSGFHIEDDFAEFGDIIARGKIISTVLQYQAQSVVGGQMIVTLGAKLDADVSIGANSFTIDEDPGFTAGDMVRFKEGGTTETVQIDGGYAGGTTVSIAGTFSNAWKKGTAVARWEQRLVFDTVSANSPYIDVVDTLGATKARLGNLDGIAGIGAEYGLWSDNVHLTGEITAQTGELQDLSITGTLDIEATGSIETNVSGGTPSRPYIELSDILYVHDTGSIFSGGFEWDHDAVNDKMRIGLSSGGSGFQYVWNTSSSDSFYSQMFVNSGGYFAYGLFAYDNSAASTTQFLTAILDHAGKTPTFYTTDGGGQNRFYVTGNTMYLYDSSGTTLVNLDEFSDFIGPESWSTGFILHVGRGGGAPYNLSDTGGRTYTALYQEVYADTVGTTGHVLTSLGGTVSNLGVTVSSLRALQYNTWAQGNVSNNIIGFYSNVLASNSATVSGDAYAFYAGLTVFGGGSVSGKTVAYYVGSDTFGYGFYDNNLNVFYFKGQVRIGNDNYLRSERMYVVSPVGGTQRTTGPTGDWVAVFDQVTDSSGEHGLACIARYGASSSTVFEAGSHWNGSSVSYRSLLSVRGDGSVIVGNPTGGAKGYGTINVSGNIYKNNTAYTNPDFVLEQWVTGDIVQYAENPRARGYTFRDLEATEAYIRRNLRLPRIDDSPSGIFDRTDIALEKIEELYIHVIELNHRIKELEAQVA